MKKFDDNRSLSPVQTSLKDKEYYAPRSSANLSSTRYYKAKVGAIMPIKWIPTLPNSDYEITVSNLVKLAVPMARQFYSSFRVYTHIYFQEDHCLFEGSDAHFTNGRSGTLDIRKPTLDVSFTSDGNDSFTTSIMNSPLDYLGLPFKNYSNLNDKYMNTKPLISFAEGVSLTRNGVISGEVSALPFAMYHNICRDYYSPLNLIQNNKYLLPDNPNDMILPYEANGKAVLFLHRSDECFDNNSSVSSTLISDIDTGYFSGIENNKYDIMLNLLRFRSWKGDYFTTASPFPNLLRGDVPSIDLSDVSGNVDFTDVFHNWDGEYIIEPDTYMFTSFDFRSGSQGGTPSVNLGFDFQGQPDEFADFKSSVIRQLNRARINARVNAQINLNQLRELEAITIFRERMARTSGEYNEMIQSQGLGNPHHEHYKPKYCGGSYQDLVFSDVTSTVETDSAPLGTRVSQGMSSATGDTVRIHSKDFGNIMICVSIVPDSVYSQGIDRNWTKLSNSEEYFPILENLAPQPILNKEIYHTGTSADNELFGYQERFAEYKSQRNIVSGAFALPDVEYRKSVLQRRFEMLPTLSPSFLSLSNFDYSIFANSLEMPFDIISNISCKGVQPISYTTIPGGLQARG